MERFHTGRLMVLGATKLSRLNLGRRLWGMLVFLAGKVSGLLQMLPLGRIALTVSTIVAAWCLGVGIIYITNLAVEAFK